MTEADDLLPDTFCRPAFFHGVGIIQVTAVPKNPTNVGLLSPVACSSVQPTRFRRTRRRSRDVGGRGQGAGAPLRAGVLERGEYSYRGRANGGGCRDPH